MAKTRRDTPGVGGGRGPWKGGVLYHRIKMGAPLGCGGGIFVSPFHHSGERDCTGPAQPARGPRVQFSWRWGAFECFMGRDMAGAKRCFRKINLELDGGLIDRTTISSAEKEGIFWTKLVYCTVCFSFELAYILMELFFKG